MLQHRRRKSEPERAFRRQRGHHPFLLEARHDSARRALAGAECARGLAAGQLAAPDDIGQQLPSVLRDRRGSSVPPPHALDEGRRIEQPAHVLHLVDAGLEKELAELRQRARRPGTAPIVVVPTLGIGRLEQRQVAAPVARQPARGRPESVGAEAGAAQERVGEEARDAPVPIEEGVNPEQAMMTRRNRDDPLDAVQARSRRRSVS